MSSTRLTEAQTGIQSPAQATLAEQVLAGLVWLTQAERLAWTWQDDHYQAEVGMAQVHLTPPSRRSDLYCTVQTRDGMPVWDFGSHRGVTALWQRVHGQVAQPRQVLQALCEAIETARQEAEASPLPGRSRGRDSRG